MNISELHKKEISILIPVYNQVCIEQVKILHSQCEAICGLKYEIIIADDGSDNTEFDIQNSTINALSNCKFIKKEINTGSAATRNFLADQSQYDWLLFMDCDMEIPNDNYIFKYLSDTNFGIINGGISIRGNEKERKTNLRCLYERKSEPKHTAEQRNLRPNKEFRSTNFLIHKDIICKCRFDERFKKSGYEDVMFGKQLHKNGYKVAHIDNPLIMTDFEDNPAYVNKIERSLNTLYTFRDELRGYSPLLTTVDILKHSFPTSLINLWHKLFGKLERKNLTGNHPQLWILNIYKLGYYLSLTKQ